MDLPNLRKKPTYSVLFGALQALEVQPNLRNKSVDDEKSLEIDDALIQRFLMSVIASNLAWLQESNDPGGEVLTAQEQRERLFGLASRRVAERCGRSGMSVQNWALRTFFLWTYLGHNFNTLSFPSYPTSSEYH